MSALPPRGLGRSRGRWLPALLLGTACNPPPTGSASTTDAELSGPAEPTSQDTPPTTTGDELSTSPPTTSTDSQGGSGGGSGATTSSTSDSTGGPVCGDGVIDPTEGCEPAVPGVDDCKCHAQTCEPFACGNGTIEPCEECDLGADNGLDKYNGCTSACKRMAHCGDKNLDAPDEVCDAGESGGPVDGTDVKCSGLCKWVGRAVFVTRAQFTGDLGGLAGADLKCRNAAAAAGLDNPGDYRAWLSNSDDSPLTTFTTQSDENAPYYRLGDVQVLAPDFSSLVSSGLAYPIEYDEDGKLVDDGKPMVWTNTTATGKFANNAAHCNNWSSAEDSWKGWHGYLNQTGPAWTEGSKSLLHCNLSAHLYCFQDAP